MLDSPANKVDWDALVERRRSSSAEEIEANRERALVEEMAQRVFEEGCPFPREVREALLLFSHVRTERLKGEALLNELSGKVVEQTDVFQLAPGHSGSPVVTVYRYKPTLS